MLFDRSQWAALRANTPLDLGPDDLAELQGINERLDLEDGDIRIGGPFRIIRKRGDIALAREAPVHGVRRPRPRKRKFCRLQVGKSLPHQIDHGAAKPFAAAKKFAGT